MNQLPMDVVNIILEYQGYHVDRNKKYICRLDMNSEKYDRLKKKSAIIKSNHNRRYIVNNYAATFSKIVGSYLIKYSIHTEIYSQKIHWYMDLKKYYKKTGNKQWTDPIEKCIHYVFEHNEKQHLPMICI
jgi:hypothetical protein